MNTLLIYAILGIGISLPILHGGEYSFCLTPEIKAKLSAVYPLEERMRRIYTTFLPQIDLEGSAFFTHDWEGWLDVGYLFGWGGGSLGGHHNTEINFIPVTLGFNYHAPEMGCWDFYAGAGVSCNTIWFHDRFPQVHRCVTSVAAGATGQVGLNYFNGSLFYGGYVAYDYRRFNYPHHNDCPLIFRHHLTFDALRIGAQIGYTF